jgi:Fe-S-cluster-containing hydrogenase component 2
MCPRGNIKMTDKGIEFTGNCELCLGCVHSCPQKAINWNNKTQGKERYLNPNIKRSELIDLIQKSK